MQVFNIVLCTVIEVAIVFIEATDVVVGIVTLIVQANVILAQGVVIAM
jgi:hypothetical protein